ncbi:DEAD/DEAH box helicase family protein [Christensenellaceae bacterium OttesenSCG-928-L17]|nr:DEAD/DEAH box helicase family protein [Christensenellaceae bacterium OttesenSCG-928-L17]
MSANIFNENTRVKIPALIHLTRLGYQYLSLKDNAVKSQLDPETNILIDIFRQQITKLNPDLDDSEISRILENIRLELGNDDLGRAFYNRLCDIDTKLIDFSDIKNNTLHIVTELTYGSEKDDNFRPDITVYINGLPVSFIEVKKPNNPEGIKAERDRIHDRFKNEKFRKFINLTQLLVFSNNMPYDDTGQNQLQGAFYATTSKGKAFFNNFREQLPSELIEKIKTESSDIEDLILKDNNLQVIKNSEEYLVNKSKDTPTNSIITSLFTPHRIFDLIKYGIAYVQYPDEDTGEIKLEKHIMRYPQFFATKAIEKTIESGKKRGVIWHTQGSGKTALAYFNVRYLTDYFSKKGIIPRFYFIVDRLDLLTQAQDEFSWRGLEVHTVQTKEALAADFRYNATKPGITIINIQKFNEEARAEDNSGYDINIQRVFFLDEAHRSYDPRGSFLADLYNSDKNSIKIALTGTPLITYDEQTTDEEGETEFSKKSDAKTTRNIFGDYIHKYYYNDSIKDGYTIQLVREEIETSYKNKVNEIIKDIQIKIGSLPKKALYAHEKFVDSMLSYIIKDFSDSRIRFGDNTIGAMVVCDSSDQAREMFRQFNEKTDEHGLSSILILHNEDDKDIRKKHTKAFRKGTVDEILGKKIDVVFVYSMLLTGFDAPRLKKLYLGRIIRRHNLLQTLTRVNRPYADFRIGYVVDFADITSEFDATNKAYFRELTTEYGDNLDGESTQDIFGSLFMSKEEIDAEVENIKKTLSPYETSNMEVFSQQVTEITDRDELNSIRQALIESQNIYNVAKLIGHAEIMEKLDFKKLAKLLTEISNRIHLLNVKNAIENGSKSRELLNLAMEDLLIDFTKLKEEELKLIGNDLVETSKKVQEEFNRNWNVKDPEYTSLYDEFSQLLSKQRINPASENIDEMKKISSEWMKLLDKIRDLNRRNSLVLAKFGGDSKAARVYTTLDDSIERRPHFNQPLFDIIKSAKDAIDEQVVKNKNMLDNPGFVEHTIKQLVLGSFDKSEKILSIDILDRISTLMAEEYLNEYKGNS